MGQTRPPAWRENASGGIPIIPRRGYEGWLNGGILTGPLDTREKLLCFAARFPGEISELLSGHAWSVISSGSRRLRKLLRLQRQR